MVKSDGDTPKSEKDSSPAQAYYGPGVPFQPPYVYSAVSAGHGPQTFVWAPPQPFLPPYGVPYATAYSHGGVYPHPAVPFVAISSRTEMPRKSSENMDQGLSKKFKKLDGFVGAVGCSSESDAGGAVHEASKRVGVGHGIVGSTDGSDENTGANQTQSRSGFEGMLSTGKSFGSLKQRTDTGAACGASTSGAGLPLEVRIGDEWRLKREKRKHANRESARRSRLRKQVVSEELLIRYESFNVENMVLKSELNQLKEDSEKLRLENAALRVLLSC